MKNIVIIGATSAIAEETAKLYANEKNNLFILARNTDKLSLIADDLKVRGANEVHVAPFEANNFTSHEKCINNIFETYKCVDVVLIAHGTLPDQSYCEESSVSTIEEINTNGVSVISLLTHIANKMEAQNSGTIAVITSVAGDRGRESNYIYGAAKGMVSTFLQGLQQRLFKSGVHVLDIKPGFVNTPMTESFKKGILWSTPQKVAFIIKKRIEKKSGFSYTPYFWLPIMNIIKNIPNIIFKRIKL